MGTKLISVNFPIQTLKDCHECFKSKSNQKNLIFNYIGPNKNFIIKKERKKMKR